MTRRCNFLASKVLPTAVRSALPRFADSDCQSEMILRFSYSVFQEAFSQIQFFKKPSVRFTIFSRSLQSHSVCLHLVLCLQQFRGQLPALLTDLSKLSANFPHQAHQPLKHIKLSTCHHLCSLGQWQLLTFFSALFLSAMQCPACDRLLPKSGFANSLWRWQQGSGPQPDWVWCCKACVLQRAVNPKRTWCFWKKFLYQLEELKDRRAPELLEEYSWIHCASFMFNDFVG